MVVICYARDIIEYDRRTPEIFNAALHMNKLPTVANNIKKQTLES